MAPNMMQSTRRLLAPNRLPRFANPPKVISGKLVSSGGKSSAWKFGGRRRWYPYAYPYYPYPYAWGWGYPYAYPYAYPYPYGYGYPYPYPYYGGGYVGFI